MALPLLPVLAAFGAAVAWVAVESERRDDSRGGEHPYNLADLNRNDAVSMLTRVYERNEHHPGRSLGRHPMRINNEDALTQWKVGVDDSFLHLTVNLGLAKVRLSVPLSDVTLAPVESQVSRGVVRPDVELRFAKGFSAYLVTSAATAEQIMQAGLGAVKAERAQGFNTVGHHQTRDW